MVPMRQERPYHSDSTAFRLLSEVKHCRARLVLRWGTTLESLVLFFFSFATFFAHHVFALHFLPFSCIQSQILPSSPTNTNPILCLPSNAPSLPSLHAVYYLSANTSSSCHLLYYSFHSPSKQTPYLPLQNSIAKFHSFPNVIVFSPLIQFQNNKDQPTS